MTIGKKLSHIDGYEGAYRNVKGNGILHYPFAIEIVAIPFNDNALSGDTQRSSKFLGGVNYSISPRSNKFEGDYQWKDKQGWNLHADNITDILKICGFRFYEYSDAKTKLPCIVVTNLVSPRIDYHGHDKSRIYTHPFSSVIVNAACYYHNPVEYNNNINYRA